MPQYILEIFVHLTEPNSLANWILLHYYLGSVLMKRATAKLLASKMDSELLFKFHNPL